jgi:hypothetical protein
VLHGSVVLHYLHSIPISHQLHTTHMTVPLTLHSPVVTMCTTNNPQILRSARTVY